MVCRPGPVLVRFWLSPGQHRGGVFQGADQIGEEVGGGGSVEDSVVEGQRQRDLLAGYDLLALYNRDRSDSADAQDRGLGQVQDRGEGVDALCPEIGDREHAAGLRCGR